MTVKAPFPVKKVIFQCKRLNAYLYRRELVDDSKYGGNGNLQMVNCYALGSGVWIGDAQQARSLAKNGIREFYGRTSTSTIASVGYNPDSGKWYGWSHRAIASFKTRKAAEKFAASVS